MSGRKLNVLLGKDPDDTNFMDPDNQHYVCNPILESARKIQPNDPRLRKAKPPQKVGAIRRSRRVELLNPDREKISEDSVKEIKEVRIFAGGRYYFDDWEGDEEQAVEEVLSAGGGSKIEQ